MQIRFLVNYSDEDGCYVANIPQLNHGVAFGNTPEEAVKEILLAYQLYIDCKKELNEPVPKPLNVTRELSTLMFQMIIEYFSSLRKTPEANDFYKYLSESITHDRFSFLKEIDTSAQLKSL